MYFGNSRVTIKTVENCDAFGLTDKTFVVAFTNGYVKDDVFLAYAKTCLGFDGWRRFLELQYVCMDNPFCGGQTSDTDSVALVESCVEIVEGLTGADVYILENSFDQESLTPTINPFCTIEANWHSNDCGCPSGYTRSTGDYDGQCFKIFPIESIGLNFTSEIDPCRFLLIAQQIASSDIDFVNTTATVYYKTYDDKTGTEQCNVATFQVSPEPCSDTYTVCWPPSGQPGAPLIPGPDGELYTPCEYCDQFGVGGGDVCYVENIAVASNTCECPYTATCYTGNYDPTNPTYVGNCFFNPGITTGEPCVNGSWNGASCADGYNDVCGSTDCIDKICKELDWFIQNYAGYEGNPGSFRGYASRVVNDSTLTGSAEEFYVSCGPTGVTSFNNDAFEEVNVTFGETSSLRQWSRIVGLLNFFTHTHENENDTGIIYDSELQFDSLNFNSIGGTSCGWFYPTNLCCPPVPEGAFDYDCPFCGASGFTSHSPSETSCCCAKNMIPVIFGLNNQTGFTAATDNGINSIGVHPIQIK